MEVGQYERSRRDASPVRHGRPHLGIELVEKSRYLLQQEKLPESIYELLREDLERIGENPETPEDLNLQRRIQSYLQTVEAETGAQLQMRTLDDMINYYRTSVRTPRSQTALARTTEETRKRKREIENQMQEAANELERLLSRTREGSPISPDELRYIELIRSKQQERQDVIESGRKHMERTLGTLRRLDLAVTSSTFGGYKETYVYDPEELYYEFPEMQDIPELESSHVQSLSSLQRRPGARYTEIPPIEGFSEPEVVSALGIPEDQVRTISVEELENLTRSTRQLALGDQPSGKRVRTMPPSPVSRIDVDESVPSPRPLNVELSPISPSTSEVPGYISFEEFKRLYDKEFPVTRQKPIEPENLLSAADFLMDMDPLELDIETARYTSVADEEISLEDALERVNTLDMDLSNTIHRMEQEAQGVLAESSPGIEPTIQTEGRIEPSIPGSSGIEEAVESIGQ